MVAMVTIFVYICMGKYSGQINLDYEPLAECIYVALAIIIYIPLFLDA